MIEINNEVNKLLQSGLKLALNYEKQGKCEEARLVLAITSNIAIKRMETSGLNQAIKDFWQDEKTLIGIDIL